MKYSAILCLLSFIFLSVISSAQTITKQFEQTKFDIKDLHMLDTLHGWATGRGGTIIKIDNAATGISIPSSSKSNHLLIQNYPNPFSSQTTISFHLTQPGKVSLSIYDLSGRYPYCSMGWHQ